MDEIQKSVQRIEADICEAFGKQLTEENFNFIEKIASLSNILTTNINIKRSALIESNLKDVDSLFNIKKHFTAIKSNENLMDSLFPVAKSEAI